MQVPIEVLRQMHPGLVNELRQYDYNSISPVIAALFTFPGYHANTLRLDVLAQLARLECSGKRLSNKKNIQALAGRHLANSPLCPMEDPVEDVFIGNVATKFGNFRVFRSIEESGDFWLERALRPLPEEIPGPLEATVREVKALLTVSEAVISRLNFSRYLSGAGERGCRLVIPKWRDLNSHATALHFTEQQLNEIGIKDEDLKPFLFHDDSRLELGKQTLGNTNLDRFPLLHANDCFVLIAPHAVLPCAIRFFIERLKMTGFLGFYEMFLSQDQAEEWFRSLQHGLDFEHLDLKLPAIPEGFPPFLQIAMKFDSGKYAHIILLDGNVEATIKDCHGLDSFNKDQEDVFAKHMQDCANLLRSQPGFNGGMTLISRSGVGMRGLKIGLEQLGSDWSVQFASLDDWKTLSRCDDMSALRLWRMDRHLKHAKANGLEVMEGNGLLNLYAGWRANDWRFLQRQMPLKEPHKLLVFEIDLLKSLRENTARSYDEHSCLFHKSNRWFLLRRHNAKSYYRDDKSLPMYAAQDALREGMLLGVVKGTRNNCWVLCRRSLTENSHQRSVLFQLWECMLNWMARCIPVIERLLPQFQISSVLVEIEVQDLEGWSSATASPHAPKESFPGLGINFEHRAMLITLPADFREEFHMPENRAEMKLVTAVFAGIERLMDSEMSEEIKLQLFETIFPNSEGRFFHVVQTDNLARLLTESDKPNPSFIPAEEHAQSLIGLAETIGSVPQEGTVRGQKVCLAYLQTAVDKLWEKMEKRLATLNRVSIVKLCCSNLAELEADAEHWSMTARSQMALHVSQTQVLKVVEERRAQRDAATLMNRLLIETSMYASVEHGGAVLSNSEHLELLAHMQNLLSIANHRDAIAEGFMSAEIHVFPNGELDVQDQFYVSVMLPYVRARFADSFRSWAKDYERWFSNYLPEKDPDAAAALERLEKPFLEEFGITIDQLMAIPRHFGRRALKNKSLVLEFEETELRSFLEKECELNGSQMEAYLSRFSLMPRRAWNKDLPHGINEYDIFPWRFRRRLSFLMRPLIQVNSSPKRRWIVYPPALETSAYYLLGNLGSGAFPTEHFQTKSMRELCGDETNRQGHKFEHEVADLFKKLGFSVLRCVFMKALGVPESLGDFGDIDVLAWNFQSSTVFIVECKRLRDANSVRDVVDRLVEYRGEAGDSLGKHIRRVEWVKRHPQLLASKIQQQISDLKIKHLLVTSDLVPMQFFPGILKPDELTSIDMLPELLKTIFEKELNFRAV